MGRETQDARWGDVGHAKCDMRAAIDALTRD